MGLPRRPGRAGYADRRNVVDWCRGKHQHLSFDTGLDNAVQQACVAILLIAVSGPISIAKIVALIDDYQIVVSPVDPVMASPITVSPRSLERSVW